MSNSLGPGETGCLRAGTYEEDVDVAVGGARGEPVTLRSYPGEDVTLVSRLTVRRAADHVTVEALHLDGRNQSGAPSPTVNANDATFRDNDITNRHTGICFVIGSAAEPDSFSWGRALRTLIERNRIHDCGRLPATNLEHGIYVEGADDTRIVGNWIYDNADRGIQLYPDAQRTVIRGNVIDGNGTGITLSGDHGFASLGAVIEGNAITNARARFNVESWWSQDNPVGEDNAVRRNCASGSRGTDDGPTGIGLKGGGFEAERNTDADPLYADRHGKDFRVRSDSACASLLGKYATETPGPPVSAPAGERVQRP